jgi:hypothetical protein
LFLAAAYKFPRGLWSDTDFTELLGFRNKPTLAGDLNAKHPFGDSSFKLLRLEALGINS